MSVEMLKAQIHGLMRDLAINGLHLRVEKRVGRKFELMAARMEIYKSIAHRQGLIIEMQANDIDFARKVA